MIKSDFRGTRISGVNDDFLYDIYVFHGHTFRVYPNGKIGCADDEDKEFANTTWW